MIIIKTEQEIQMMKRAGELLAKTHKEIAKMIKPGITTYEIDKFVEEYLKEHNAIPEQKGYYGYPYAICASVNDEICHGFPRKEPLKKWRYSYHRYGGKLRWLVGRFCLELWSRRNFSRG